MVLTCVECRQGIPGGSCFLGKYSAMTDGIGEQTLLLPQSSDGISLKSNLHCLLEFPSVTVSVAQSDNLHDKICLLTCILPCLTFESSPRTSMNHLPITRQFRSVAQSCPTLCDPMNRSTPGLPVHHQLPEFTQTHIHRVRDAIQPSHPLSSPSPPAPNPSQHQSLFQ